MFTRDRRISSARALNKTATCNNNNFGSSEQTAFSIYRERVRISGACLRAWCCTNASRTINLNLQSSAIFTANKRLIYQPRKHVRCLRVCKFAPAGKLMEAPGFTGGDWAIGRTCCGERGTSNKLNNKLSPHIFLWFSIDSSWVIAVLSNAHHNSRLSFKEEALLSLIKNWIIIALQPSLLEKLKIFSQKINKNIFKCRIFLNIYVYK